LVCFTAGAGSHSIDFLRYPVEAGQIYFMPPGQVHSWSFEGRPEGWVINFSVDFLRAFLLDQGYLDRFTFFSGRAEDSVVRLVGAFREQVYGLLEEMLRQFEGGDRSDADLLRVRLLELFLVVRAGHGATVSGGAHAMGQKQQVMVQLRRLIDQHYKTLRLPGEYARLLHITPNHLNALCQEVLGRPAGAVIRDRVLLEAKRLLTNADMTAAEIADSLNFQDNSYFSRFFKKYTGVTPEGFRKALYLVLLLLWLAPLSCVDRGQIYRYGGDPPLSTEHLDTLRQPVYTVKAKPTIFEQAFFTGTFLGKESRSQMTVIGIGRLKSESGKIIPCSPIGMDVVKPCYVNFPIGEFPVQVAIAKQNGDERVAFSRILFSAEPVAKWEMARTAEQAPLPVFDTLSYFYPVDGGEGLFIDSVSNQAFNVLCNKDPDFWINAMEAGTKKHERRSWDFNVFEFQGHNLIMFSTGMGDGRYTSYIGRDSSGQPCQLLTDFDMFDWIDER
jgi:AraC family transcriptional activator of pobA